MKKNVYVRLHNALSIDPNVSAKAHQTGDHKRIVRRM